MNTRFVAFLNSIVLVLGLLGSTVANGAVNLKNGNFHVAYDDLTVDQNSGLKLSRHYNSLSPNKGWFGWGWGTEFETRLYVMPDGLIAVRENGNAHVTFYGTPEAGAVSRAAEKIIQALRVRGQLQSDQEAALREQLVVDPLLRLEWTERLGLSGPLPAIGTRLDGAEFESEMDRFAETSDQKLFAHALITRDKNLSLLRMKYAHLAAKKALCGQLVRVKEGFERGTCSDKRFGDQQSFDLKGRLTKLNVQDSWLRLDYGKSRFPERITDESGKSIELSWNDKGFISRISGMEDGKRIIVEYTYDQNGNLIKSAGRGANTYRHEYNSRHKMTLILYSDETRKTLEYDIKNRVTKITQRDGQQALFRYETNDRGDTEIVYLRQLGGEPREVRRLRYSDKGQLLFDRSAKSTEQYEYHPSLGKVTRYRDARFDCHYKYNHQALPTEENCTSPGFSNFFEYDSAGKVIKSTLTVPPDLQNKVSGKYIVLTMQYDRLGRVVRATETESGAHVIISYASDSDKKGKVASRIGMEDPVARSRFSAATYLQERMLRDIGQRTQINDGFVMVRE